MKFPNQNFIMSNILFLKFRFLFDICNSDFDILIIPAVDCHCQGLVELYNERKGL